MWTIENTAFVLDPNWILIGSQNAWTHLKKKKTQHLLGSKLDPNWFPERLNSFETNENTAFALILIGPKALELI